MSEWTARDARAPLAVAALGWTTKSKTPATVCMTRAVRMAMDAERLQVQDVKPPSLDEGRGRAVGVQRLPSHPSTSRTGRTRRRRASDTPRGIRGGDPQSVAFSPIGQPRPPGGAHALGHAANAPRAVQGQFDERRCFWRYRGRRAHARASCRAGVVNFRSSLREKPTRKKAIKFSYRKRRASCGWP